MAKTKRECEWRKCEVEDLLVLPKPAEKPTSEQLARMPKSSFTKY